MVLLANFPDFTGSLAGFTGSVYRFYWYFEWFYG
jgi:hypothetical protein